MFFLHELERTIVIHPSFFGAKIMTYIKEKLLEDVEGKNSGTYFTIAVLDNLDISEGRVQPGSGCAEYAVHYKAVVWRPFKDEVVDGRVEMVIDTGFSVLVGPLDVFVSRTGIPADIKYNANVSPPQWTDNKDQVIEKGSHVRIKIIGIRSEMGAMRAVGRINEDYLGPL